jgi:hypothetical protein
MLIVWIVTLDVLALQSPPLIEYENFVVIFQIWED